MQLTCKGEKGARSGKEEVAAPELGADGDAPLAGASALSDGETGALGGPGREKERWEAAQPGAGVGPLLRGAGRAAELRGCALVDKRAWIWGDVLGMFRYLFSKSACVSNYPWKICLAFCLGVTSIGAEGSLPAVLGDHMGCQD